MATSTADYLLVGGHYPVWSVCQHGPTRALVDRLKPLLERYHITGYMSGHDHCQAYLDERRGPAYIVTGTGDNCCYEPSNLHAVPKGSCKWYQAADTMNNTFGGFASMTATTEHLTVTFYDQDGRPLYISPKVHPRGSAQKAPSVKEPGP